MLLTDREWLRFLTFAFVTAGAFGAITAGVFFLEGVPPMTALAAAVAWCGALGLILHLVVRKLVDLASEPPAEEPDPETETTA